MENPPNDTKETPRSFRYLQEIVDHLQEKIPVMQRHAQDMVDHRKSLWKPRL